MHDLSHKAMALLVGGLRYPGKPAGRRHPERPRRCIRKAAEVHSEGRGGDSIRRGRGGNGIWETAEALDHTVMYIANQAFLPFRRPG
jgi:hypothetical protein